MLSVNYLIYETGILIPASQNCLVFRDNIYKEFHTLCIVIILLLLLLLLLTCLRIQSYLCHPQKSIL